MAQSLSVLIADTDDPRRRELGLALYEGGYEVVNAVNGEEALRFTAGLDPALVVVHTGLDGISPLELHSRLNATGLRLPPFLILSDDGAPIDEYPDDGEFHFLSPDGLEPGRFLFQVRLLLLAGEIGGEVSETLDALYGDLTRIAFGDLLHCRARLVER